MLWRCLAAFLRTEGQQHSWLSATVNSLCEGARKINYWVFRVGGGKGKRDTPSKSVPGKKVSAHWGADDRRLPRPRRSWRATPRRRPTLRRRRPRTAAGGGGRSTSWPGFFGGLSFLPSFLPSSLFPPSLVVGCVVAVVRRGQVRGREWERKRERKKERKKEERDRERVLERERREGENRVSLSLSLSRTGLKRAYEKGKCVSLEVNGSVW